MKILKISYKEIDSIDLLKESKNLPINTSLPVSTTKFWHNWIINKLIDAGFDMSKSVEREDSFENFEIIFTQKDNI